ncbi:MAG: DNRLRE domain-containing protein, partial [Acidobacteria bacterium]|nr:DNRLRE domain-containing protein [Acidobacteriota bacterium]
IQSGEWLEFTVDVGDELVTSTGNWWFEVRASGTSEVRFSLAVDGSSLGSFNFPATGGFNQYQTYSSPGYFTLPRGQHVLRLTATGANFNLNWLRFWEVHKAYVTDVFSNSVAGRSPGDPLNGAPVESGGQIWAASPTVVFGQGEVTNQTGWQHAVATVPFDPASHAGSTAAVLEAEIDPSEVSWIGLGFSKSATGAFWSDGELWAFLRSDGRLHVKAGGLAVSLLDMAAAAPGFQAGTNRLKLSYDWGAGQVRVWLNEVEQTLAPSGLGGYVPQILHAGFHGHRQGGLAIGGLLHLDDFALGLSGPPAAPAGVQASDGTRTDGVQVTWSPASGAEAFRIYRVPEGTAGVGTALSEQVSGTSFLDRTAAPGQRYHYRVQYRLSEGVWSLISTSDLGWRQSFPHGVTSLSPVADAYVTQEMGGSNWGSSQSLRLRHFASGLARYSFLEFDVPVVSGPIRSAVLRLKARNNVVGGVSVFATSDLFWQESQINWNNWTTCSGSTFLRKTWQVQPGAEVFLDVSEAVTATGRVTIALATDFDWGGQDFWSREGSAADRPRLDVTYATSGPQRLVLQPVADAHVVQAQPNDNFGGVDFLRLRTMDFGFGHHAYLKFQVSGVLGGISSATLRMRTQENGLDQVGVYKLPDTSWTELGITWNNAPLQGALPYGQYGPVPASSWFDMPLGSLGTLLPGNGVYTVGMVTGGNVDGLDFWSRDSLCRPTLVLTTSGS